MNKEHNTSKTTEPAIAVDTVLAPVIKIKKGKINFNSRKFKKGLERVRKECEKIDKYSKIDPIRMFDRFDI